LSRAGLGGRVIGMVRTCPDCRGPVSDSASVCPRCGREFKSSPLITLLIVAGVILGTIIVVLFLLPI
jgi:uncharacterized paraquat-inducible protein A